MPARKKISNERPKPSHVVMHRIDHEIAMLVHKRYVAIGMSDEEVSFLLGQPNKYVFNLLDPTKKTKFKTEHLDILPTILNCSVRVLVPDQIGDDPNIRLRGVKIETAEKTVYEYAIVGEDDQLIIQQPIVKHNNTGLRKQLNPDVHSVTMRLLQEGFFDELRSALELFLYYKQELQTPFRPSDLQKSLAACLRKETGKEPLMLEKRISARYYYHKNGPAEVADLPEGKI